MIDLESVMVLLLVALAVALVTRWTKRPYTIALVIWGLILGLIHVFEPIALTQELVMGVFLPPLLFEGALHIKEATLRKQSGVIFALALGGTLLTAALVGAAAHLILGLDLIVALLLGIIVAPTDPVSVLATFKQAKVDEDLATIVEGESLFNDSIAVVIYMILVGSLGGSSLSFWDGLVGFLLSVGGGVIIGLGLGLLTSRLMERVDDHLVEVMMTLIAAYGAYLVGEHLHVSGVIAVVAAGLVVGNRGLLKTSSVSRERVVGFWEVVAFLVNSAIFLLIGFELRPDQFSGILLWSALIFAVLQGGRALLVYTLGAVVHRKRGDLPLAWRHVIFWGGLRGAVPVALAIGLPAGLTGRSDLVAITFGVVLISLLGQGLSMPSLLKRLGLTQESV